MYLIAADKHTSTLVMANLQTTGDMCFGAFVAGIVVTLAHLPGQAYTEFLCVFTAIGLIPFAITRARIPAPGMMSTLMYGICILLGQFTAIDELWKTVTGYLVFINVISGASATIPAMLVWPTTARHEAKQLMKHTTLDLGHKISSYASALFQPPEPSVKAPPLSRDPSRCLDYTLDLQRSAGTSGPILQPFSICNPAASTDTHTARTTEASLDQQQLPEQSSSRAEATVDRKASGRQEPEVCIPTVALTAESIRQGIMEETDPGRHGFVHDYGRPFTSINSLRPAVLKAKRLIQETRFELWIPVHHTTQLQHWIAATDALDHVILTAAALESVLEGEAPLLDQGSLCVLLERVGVLADFQLVYSQLAASCSAMAAAVNAFHHPNQAGVASELLLRPAWALLEHGLAQAVQQALHGYWHHWRRQSESHSDMFSPEVQSRALLYLFTLTHSVMEAMAAAEQAIELATASVATAAATPPTAEAITTTATQPSVTAATVPPESQLSATVPSQSQLPANQQDAVPPGSSSASKIRMPAAIQHAQRGQMDPLQEALHNHLQRQSQVSAPQHEGEDEAQPLIAAPQGLLQVSIHQRPAKKYFKRLGVEVHIPVSNKQQLQQQSFKAKGSYCLKWIWCQIQLLWPIMNGLVAAVIWLDWLQVPQEAIAVLKSKPKRAQMLRSRKFQYGIKYWTCNAIVLCGAVIVSDADKPNHLASWHPLFLVATVNVVFSEKVDATIAKSVQRVTGSVIGAVYAFLVMLRPEVATNPYAVATMVCISAFMCGLLVEHRFRYGSFLALYTSAVVMLAQYNPAPGSHGSVKFLYARIADIFMGVIITSLFTLVLPWYAREDALGKLGGAVADGAQLIEDLYQSFYQELQKPLASAQAGPDQPVTDSTHGQSSRGAHESPQNEAAAKRVAGTLAGVQAQVAKEAVVWRSGPLVMTPLVNSTLGAAQVMLERIAALEAMLQQAPIVSGRFTPAPYLYLAKPLHQDMSAAVAAASQLGRSINDVLCAHPSHHGLLKPLQHLRSCIHQAVETRVAFRLRYWELRAADHAEARTPANSSWLRERTLDDAVRYLSFVFACGKACDKIVLLARMVERDPWIGKSSRLTSRMPCQLWQNQKATSAPTDLTKAS
ncbi:TPA: hypothetical protein ACH3X1_016339 [Trebouxia sp. C0004]